MSEWREVSEERSAELHDYVSQLMSAVLTAARPRNPGEGEVVLQTIAWYLGGMVRALLPDRQDEAMRELVKLMTESANRIQDKLQKSGPATWPYRS